jgi:cytochrome b561
MSSSCKQDAVARRRWLVHLALMVSFAAAFASSIFLSDKYLGHSGLTDHSIIGGVVLALVVIHLFQRRRTVWRLVRRLADAANSSSAQVRLALSDSILWLLLLNATGSGLADFATGHTIMLPGSPSRLGKWHLDSVLVLTVYVITHILRRRSRLRTSHVR